MAEPEVTLDPALVTCGAYPVALYGEPKAQVQP